MLIAGGSGVIRFFRGESGAVTVDWVVLTAAVIGMGMIVLAPIGFSQQSVATNVGAQINNTQVGYGN